MGQTVAVVSVGRSAEDDASHTNKAPSLTDSATENEREEISRSVRLGPSVRIAYHRAIHILGVPESFGTDPATWAHARSYKAERFGVIVTSKVRTIGAVYQSGCCVCFAGMTVLRMILVLESP
ncbi:hypothetical protein EJ03DRAFT_328198 [Teratosphaeria nubilosa]|uniref:Uncharacterized protein n=1 Tax=Teratosphaeria nubilosa TaxID=161662 RepID=A0A6G1L7Y6_9PEZI|nr:hypothetical protein EJ03DRAFT_328198 [Teratosphaeria nubilosa]